MYDFQNLECQVLQYMFVRSCYVLLIVLCFLVTGDMLVIMKDGKFCYVTYDFMMELAISYKIYKQLYFEFC